MTSWADLKRGLQRAVSKQGAREVAKRLPAHHATVYRLLKGETTKPSKALKAAVERLVEKDAAK